MRIALKQDRLGGQSHNTSASLPTLLLSVSNLTIQSGKKGATNTLVDDVSFSLEAGKTLALTGESGSGKTITSLALLGLLPETLLQPRGEIRFKGHVLSHRGKHRFAQVRGEKIAMIFQEPLASLNPVFRIGDQITDVLKTHLRLSFESARERVLMLFDQVDLDDPGRIFSAYPHQLSGGMAQRVMIAMALSCNPELIIADEPTTALDVLTQIKILDLITKLQKVHEFALLLISHDTDVAARMADSILRMDAGRIVKTDQQCEVTSLPL